MANTEVVSAHEYRDNKEVGLYTTLYFTWNVDYANEKIVITDCYMSAYKYTNAPGGESSIIPTPENGDTANFLWHVYCYQGGENTDNGIYPPTTENSSQWYVYESKIDTTIHYFYTSSNSTNKLSFNIPFDNITWNGSTFSFRIAAKLKPSWDTSTWFTNGSRPDKSITVNCPSYTVSYNANGGSGAPSAQTKYYRQNLTLSSTEPIKANSTFLGWATSSTATTATYQAGGTYTNNSGTTLYAVWKTNITTFSTSYNLNGGNFPSNETAPPTTYEVTGTQFKIPRPTKTGFTFYQWYFSNLSTRSKFWCNANPWVTTNATTKTVSYDDARNMWVYRLGDAGKTVSAVASWTPIEYSIAYDFDGGAFTYIRSGNSSVYNQLSDEGTVGTNYCPTYLYNPLGTIKYDLSNYSPSANHTHNDYFHLDSPSKLGFIFKGWYITGMDSTAHNFWYDGQPNTTNSTFFDTSLVANINAPARHLRASTGTVTYRALWDPISYDINYILNGGTLAHEHGWVDDNSSNPYARQYNPLFVYYDNSQYDPVNAQRHNVFTIDTPTKAGYTFNGWTITGIDNPASSTSDYSLAYMWDNGKKAITTTTYNTPSNFAVLEFRKLRKTSGTVTFTANWTPNNYLITLNSEVSGAGAGTKTIYTTHDTNVYLNNTRTKIMTTAANPISLPVRPGYTFIGYYSASSGGTKYIGSNRYITSDGITAGKEYTSNQTWYAQWQPNTLTVQFNANGGTGSMSNETFTYGTAKTLTANSFTAPPGNYKFGGWAASSAEAIAGTIKYNNKESVTNPNGITSGSTTLYAIWYKSIKFYSGNNKGTETTVKQYYNGNNNSGGNITTPTKATCTDISGWTELGWRDDQIAGGSQYNFNTSISPSVTSYYAVYSRPVTFYHGYNKASSTSVTQYYNSYNVYSCTTPAKTVCANIGNNWNPVGWRSDTEVDMQSFGFNQTITRSNNIFYAIYSRTINFYYFTSAASATKTNGSKVQYLNSGNTTVSSVTSYPLYANATYGWSPLGWRTDTTASTASTSQTGTTTVNFSPAYNISPPLYCAVYSRSVAFAYKANGGGTAPSNTTGTQYYNANNSDASTVSLKTAGPITRVGYKQTKWALDSANGDTKYDVSTNVTFPSTGWLTAATRTLYAVWDRAGSVYINTSDGWQLAIPYIWNGSQWQATQAYVYNGSGWKTLS